MENLLVKIENYYRDYPELPFISNKRDLEKFIEEVNFSKSKLVPKKNMQRTKESLLPGDIILLWRINFGTFTTESIKEGMYPKYFEYSYGINAPDNLENLINLGYVILDKVSNSLGHNTIAVLKNLLKEKGLKGLTKLKKEEVHTTILEHYSEDELLEKKLIRGYILTSKGERTLDSNQDIIERHPKKKF